MKIMHPCLAAFYIDDYGYQENILPKAHKKSGHDVEIVASTEVYSDEKTLTYCSPKICYPRFNTNNQTALLFFLAAVK